MRKRGPSHRRARPRCASALGLLAGLAAGWFPAGVAAQSADATEGSDAQKPEATGLAALTRAAIEEYPGVRAAHHAIEAAAARLNEAQVSPFFQLEARASATVAPSARGTPTYSPDDELPLGNTWRPVTSIGVEGAVPLYTFGKIRAGWDAAEAGIEAAEEGRRQTLARLRRDVRKAYFALQLALDVQQMIREAQGKLERATTEIEERSKEDPDVDAMDRYRLQAAVAEVEARSSEAKRLESSARAALRVLAGKRRIRIPPCPSEPVDIELQPADFYIRRALEQRPEAEQLDAAVDARQAQLDVQHGQYFPDLALALRASQSYGPGVTDQENPFIQDGANRSRLGAALVARWSLDLWGNVHRVRRAEAQLAEVRARAEEADVGIRLEVAKTHDQVHDARRREQAWGRAEDQTRSWFVAAAQSYQVGTLEPKELVDAVKAYFQARFKHLEAIRDFNTGVAELERVTGIRLRADDEWHEDCRE